MKRLEEVKRGLSKVCRKTKELKKAEWRGEERNPTDGNETRKRRNLVKDSLFKRGKEHQVQRR